MTKILDTDTGLSLTVPQDLALRILRRDGQVQTKDLKAKGLDIRALNALVRLLPAIVVFESTTAFKLVTPEPIVASEGGAGGEGVVLDSDVLPKAAKTKKVAKEAKEAKVGEPCLCACGGTAKAGSKFICGHDSKLHAVIRKIDRGEAGLEALPPAGTPSGDRVLAWLATSKWCQAHPKFAEILASATLPKEDAAPAAEDAATAQDAATGSDTAPGAEAAESPATTREGPIAS